MKKILLLLITTVLLTGCTATYDITFDEDIIHDSIKVYTDSKNVNTASKEKLDNFLLKIGEWERGYDYYKRELYTTDKITGYHYTYDFPYDQYDATSQIRKCYKDFTFTYDNTINLKTSNEFLCSTYYKEVKNIEISITSKYQITSSNADKKTNNTHTWIINKNNYKNKPIIIEIDKNTKAKKETPEIDLKMILIFIIFILLILVYIVNKKDLKRQK